MALTLSVPCADWLTPCEIQRDDARRCRNIWKNAATSRSASPVASAVAATLPAMLARARQRLVETAGVRSM